MRNSVEATSASVQGQDARYLGHGFAWANGRLFDDGKPVGPMDSTAEALSPFYVRDKAGVVFHAKNGVHGLDFDQKLERNGGRIESADSKTFRLITDLIAEDDRRVYVAGTPIAGVNPGGYELLGQLFVRAKSCVYFGVSQIPDADPKTFELVTGAADQFFARDARHAYHRFRLLDGIDGASFEVLPGGYLAADKNAFYSIETSGSDRSLKPLDSPRRGETQALGYGFYRSGENLYAAKYTFRPLTVAEGETAVVAIAKLEFLAADLAHDGSTVFNVDTHQGMADAELSPSALDPATVEVLSPHYLADANRVALRCRGSLDLLDADRKSFYVLQDGYARDANRIYPLGSDKVSPAGFELLGAGYARAPEAVYRFNEMHCKAFEIYDSDPGSFKLLEPTGHVAVDASRVYLNGKAIRGATPEEVRVLRGFEGEQDGPVVATKQGVYDMAGNEIPGVDAETFRVLSPEPFCGRDRQHVYAAVIRGEIKPLKADGQSFELLTDGYARDCKMLLYDFMPVKGVKPETCQILGGGYAVAGGILLFKGKAIRSAWVNN